MITKTEKTSALDKYLVLSLHTYEWASLTLLQQAELQDKAMAELADLRAQVARLKERAVTAESNLRFYDGLIIGDGDHDKVMLARDGEVFLKCLRLLGLDVSGTDIQEIPDAIERLQQKVQA